VIIIELSYRIVYRDNFDLSYRLSIGNSIWHIVTALLLPHLSNSQAGFVLLVTVTRSRHLL